MKTRQNSLHQRSRKKLSSTVRAVLAMRGCLQAIGGDPTAVDTSVGLFTNKVSETVSGYILHLPRDERRPAERAGAGVDQRRTEPR